MQAEQNFGVRGFLDPQALGADGQARWSRAALDSAVDIIRDVPVVETPVEQFLNVLSVRSVSTNVYLRRMHNFALACPILPRRQWPSVHYGEHRAITLDEHRKVVAHENNRERRAFYELCCHLGGSHGDIAQLTADDVQASLISVQESPAFSEQRTSRLYASISFLGSGLWIGFAEVAA